MMALITTKIVKRALSIKFKQQGGSVKDTLRSWRSIQRELLLAAVENKPAKFHCYSKDEQFRLDKVFKSALVIESVNHAAYVYSTVFSDSWPRCDLEALVTTQEFELSQLWIHLCSSASFKESAAEPSSCMKFFELVNPVVLGVVEEVEGVECIGMVADGYEMLCLNLTDIVLDTLVGKLESCCKTFKFDLKVNGIRT